MRNATAVFPPDASPAYAGFGFSPAVRCGNLIFLSGLIGLLPDDSIADTLQRQVELVFEQAAAILAESGASLDDVVAIESYHAPAIALDEQLAVFMAVRSQFLAGPILPTWTALGVASLAFPEALVEVKMTAYQHS